MRRGARRHSLRILGTCGLVVGLGSSFRAAEPDDPRPTVVIVVGAPGTDEYGAEFAEWAGSEMGDAAALDGAKALAMTALDFFADADLRARARAFFEAGA